MEGRGQIDQSWTRKPHGPTGVSRTEFSNLEVSSGQDRALGTEDRRAAVYMLDRGK